MSTLNDRQSNDVKAKETSDTDEDTRNFIETHNVTKVAPKPTPGAGEESADLVQPK